MARTRSQSNDVNGSSEVNVPTHVHDQHKPGNDMDSTKRVPNRLILCFDGTGNSFQGNSGDTNIVKLYNMFERTHPHQMHYYQPGIGTYPAEGSVNVSWFGKIKRSFSQTIDSGFATTFDSHVIAGYRFLMRYYGPGDRIYIFGFSRGAFTARFLARMIALVGLLSMGNEEMVPFAYKVYQDYEMGNDEEAKYMKLFKKAFCRAEHDHDHVHNDDESGVKVHFLGLFDTVSSVGTLDVPWVNALKVPEVHGTAEHVRHAVAIDERRVKFKAALLAQDRTSKNDTDDVKEVFFPGNHGDVGGGWMAESDAEVKTEKWGDFFKRLFSTQPTGKPNLNKEKEYFQLSDIALKWMIDELDNIKDDNVQWNADAKCDFLCRFNKHRDKAIKSFMHDTLKFGRGSSVSKVTLWNFMEYIPFIIKRWELYSSGWEYRSWPLNMGDRRDIPKHALFHYSVLERMRAFPDYKPWNDVWCEDTKKQLKDVDFHKSPHGAHREPDRPHFVHEPKLDAGTVRPDVKCEFPEGVQKTDRIYSLAMPHQRRAHS